MEQRKKSGLSRKLLLAGMLGASGLALAGCDVTPPGGAVGKFLRMGWPEGITPEATEVGNFWVWVWVTAWTIGIIMWALMLWNVFFNTAKRAKKAGKGELPKQLQYNIPLEIVLTIIPITIVSVLFFFTVQAQDQVNALDKNPKVTVDVTGFQWNWKFGYANVAADLSPTGSDYVGTNEAATKAAEESAYERDADGNIKTKELPNGEEYQWGGPVHGKSRDDRSYLHFNNIETKGSSKEIPVLVLPSQTPIEFRLASADVSHSFWVPEFLFKRDVYANPEANNSVNRFQIEKIEEEGAFVGRCAEMCGTYHAMMNFEVRVVSPEKFRDYLKFREANPEAPNSKALESIGEAPYATTTRPFVTERDGTRSGDNTYDYAASK